MQRSKAPQTHTLQLDHDVLFGVHVALCSCGWESPERRSKRAARVAWEDHCDVVFMEATGG